MSTSSLLKLSVAAGIAGALVTACARRARESWSPDDSDSSTGSGGRGPGLPWRRWRPASACACDCEGLADTVRGLEQEVAWLRRELEAIES